MTRSIYDRVDSLESNESGVPSMIATSDEDNADPSTTTPQLSVDATMKKHSEALKEKRKNLRRLLRQGSDDGRVTKSASSPDLKNAEQGVEQPLVREARSFEESLPSKSVDQAPSSESVRSSSPTSVEGISQEKEQERTPKSITMGSGERSSSGRRKEARLKIFVLLLQPTSRTFELIQIVYNPLHTTIGDVLALIPENATEQELGSQIHRGFCRPMDGLEITDTTMLASGRRRSNCARIHKGEILVAIPEGHTGPDCVTLAQPILQNPKLVRLLSQTNPKRRRSSRSRRSAPGSSMGPRRRANPPIATVIEEGDEEDEEEEDIASDLYSVGSEGRRHATAPTKPNSPAKTFETPTLLPPQEEEDDDDCSIASNDSSIASSCLARQIEELAESQGRRESVKPVRVRAPASPRREALSVASPRSISSPQSATPRTAPSPSRLPRSPVRSPTINHHYKEEGDMDCLELGRAILTTTRRVMRIFIRRSLEYYAIKSKEYSKRSRRRRNNSILSPTLVIMCCMLLLFVFSITKFTSDPQAAQVTVQSKEASIGVFGLLKVLAFLYLMVEGQRNISSMNTDCYDRRMNTPKRFRAVNRPSSAKPIRPMVEFDDGRSASLSPRREGSLYMNDWRDAPKF